MPRLKNYERHAQEKVPSSGFQTSSQDEAVIAKLRAEIGATPIAPEVEFPRYILVLFRRANSVLGTLEMPM